MSHSLPRVVTSAVVAALAATGLTAVSGAGPAAAATTTFTSTAPVSIGAASQVVAGAGGVVINDGKASAYPVTTGTYVDGLAGTVTDVNLRLTGFSHERPDDVNVLLVSPTGTKSVVMSDVAAGGTPAAGLDLLLDEDAPQPLPAAGALQSTSYRPVNQDDGATDFFPTPVPNGVQHDGLAAFDGSDPTGVWSLYVYDDTFDYFGSITGWSLELTTTGPAPYPSTVPVAGLPTTVTDVDVTLTGLDHPDLRQVDVLLVGPQGQQATILSDVHPADPTPALTLDDSGTPEIDIPAKEPTAYRPTNKGAAPDDFPAPAPVATGTSALSAFNGTDPNGPWRLFVVDDTDGLRGSLGGWSLRITTDDVPAPVPTPTSPTTPAGPTGPATGGSGSDTVGPTVRSTRPSASATAVRRGADLTATLSEAVRPGTVSRATAYVVRVGTTRHLRAGVSWQPGTRRIVIDPAALLKGSTTYRVVVTTAVRDRAGNRLDQDPARTGLQAKTWRFTTR